jgi:anti-sigma-K factor RskA
MNEMSELEMQLLSWTPRRPSPALERRLFAAPPAPPAETLPHVRFSWLVPATAALALTCVLLNQRYAADFPTAAGTSPMVAMILSNQSAPAYLPGNFQAEQNNVPVDAFKWASGSKSRPGTVSLSPSRPSHRP